MNAESIMLAAAAAATGLAAASLAGPMTLGWTAGQSVLRRRMNALTATLPGRAARLAGAGLMASLLIGGGLAAYAAAPAAPDRLPAEVTGVTGSGDTLSLQLKDGATTRTLKVGDVYDDGWKVDAISPSEASLSKAGEVRRVGLNPTGALAAAEAVAPSKVAVTFASRRTDEEIIQQLLDSGEWDGTPSKDFGLTLDETRRRNIYQGRIEDVRDAKIAAAMKATGLTRDQLQASPELRVRVSAEEERAAVGAADLAAYDALMQKALAVLKANPDWMRPPPPPESGPDRIYLPADMTNRQARDAGLPSFTGYTFGKPDTNGGVTAYRTPALARAGGE